MYLQTKTEVTNAEENSLGLTPEYITINMILKLSELIGVREFVIDGKLDPSRAVVILKTGEEYGILTPYRQVVSLLYPPPGETTAIYDITFEPTR